MPISHPRRVHLVARPIPPHSQALFIHALSLHRQVSRDTLRQSHFIRSFMSKKEGSLHPRRTIHVHVLRNHTAAKAMYPTGLLASDPPSPCVSISARRSASLQSRLSFDTYRQTPPVLSIQTPLPNLIPPSKFSSPLTPANQVLHAPFHPPEPHKGTPSKRRRNYNWQWSPMLVPSPGIDENTPPARALDTPDSPICDLSSRFSLIALPKYVSRRLSYPQVCGSPCTPESQHGQALASPVLIRSSLWPSSPVTSPRYQLDDLQFSPFHVIF
ncbi:hypothetical protein B0H13DRAFT_1940161 [Mycena leptocephala]|nr:hypothetical protein B0H13DRAFT_1940161 [Mycena leptocephala]